MGVFFLYNVFAYLAVLIRLKLEFSEHYRWRLSVSTTARTLQHLYTLDTFSMQHKLTSNVIIELYWTLRSHFSEEIQFCHTTILVNK